MKASILKINLLLFAILTLSASLWGQEKKNSIKISGIASHYINNEKYDLHGPYGGYYESSFDPGTEVLFFRNLSESIKIGTGINYQKGRVASYMSGLRRFQFGELTIPVVIQKDFFPNRKNGWFLSTGVYSGKMILRKAENPDSFGHWHGYTIMDRIENYSDDVYFADIYFDTGYSRIISCGELSVAPFVKYRINTTWLNYHQKELSYGIKLNFTVEFKDVKEIFLHLFSK